MEGWREMEWRQERGETGEGETGEGAGNMWTAPRYGVFTEVEGAKRPKLRLNTIPYNTNDRRRRRLAFVAKNTKLLYVS
jgi:hypothetical protein